MRVLGTLTADLQRRHLTGRLLPWGVPGNTSRGTVSFLAGSLHVPDDPSAVVLNIEHDQRQPVGRLVSAADDGTAMVATFHVPPTPAGDQVLLEADAGLRCGLSVECMDLDLDWSTRTIRSATLSGAAVVVAPAFEGATVIELAASEVPPPAPTTPAPPADPPPAAAPPTAPAPAAAAPLMAAASPARTDLRGMSTLYEALSAMHSGRALTPELSAALADITRTATIGVTPNQWADELWSHVAYQREIVPLITSADLTSYRVVGWRWVVRPAVAAWAGDKTAVPSNSPTTAPVTIDASRLAGAHDVDRKFRDFGDDSFFASYYAAMTESYAMLSDAAALADLKAAALVVTPTAGQLLTNMNALYAAVRAYGPTAIVVGFGVYDALAAITQANAPGNVVPLPWVNLLVPSPLQGAADALAICKPAATFYELPSSPIRVEAIDMVKGGIDPGVFGYYATLVNQPLGLAKITGATALEAGAYPDPPVVMDGTPQPEPEPVGKGNGR